jgi:hypothetical protein
LRVSKILTTSVTAAALAFSMLASAIPASAISSGYHGAWVAQSAYAAAAPGQTVQMSAVYQNTGDQPWIKGTAGQQANFAAGSLKDPAYPRDTTAYADAGWNAGQNWLSSNRFAAQANDLVATSALGSWVWSVKVPATQAAGAFNFNGTPVVDGSSWLEDYGFFLTVTVGAGTVLISSTSPASPAANAQPIITGTGAGNGCGVSILDGSTIVATTTSDASGNFQAATSVLAEGTHTLSATSTCPDGSFGASGNTKTYVYDKTAPTVSSVTAASPTIVTVVFSEPVNQTGTTGSSSLNAANYVFTSGAAIAATPAPAIDASGTTITLYLTAARPNPSGDTLTISAVADLAGNIMTTQAVAYIVNDTTAPTITSVTSSGPSGGGNATTVKVNWSEPVVCTGAQTVYNVDGVTEVYASGGGTSATPKRCTLTLSPTLAPGTTHTLTVTNEKDLGGNTQGTNPASASFTVTTSAALVNMVITGVSNPSGNTVRITYNVDVLTPITSTWTVKTTPAGTTTACTACAAVVAASGATNAVDIALTATPFVGATECSSTATSCSLQITNVAADAGLNGETFVPAVQSTTFTMNRDTTSPSGISVTQIGTTQNTFDLKWSENVSAPLACVAGGTCVVRIKSGSTIVASSIANENAGVSLTLNLGDNTAGDTKTRITLTANGVAYADSAAATTALAYGTYILTADAATVNDLWFTPNAALAITTLPVAVVDTTRPTMAGAIAAGNCTAGLQCKTFTFTFNDKMATSGTASVLDTSHYTLNGGAVTGTLQIDATGKIVTLDMISSAPCTAATSPCAESFAVTGVTDLAGNLVNPNPSLFNFTRTF